MNIFNLPIDYVHLNSLVTKWSCSKEEILQLASRKGLKMFIYVATLIKILKVPKTIQSYHQISNRSAQYLEQYETLKSDRYEEIRTVDIEKLLENSTIDIKLIESNDLSYNKCPATWPPICVSWDNLYVSKAEVARFESTLEQPKEESTQARNHRWANRAKGKNKTQIAKKIVLEEAPIARKGINTGHPMSIKTIIREINKALKK